MGLFLPFKSKTRMAHTNHSMWTDGSIHDSITDVLITDAAIVTEERLYAKSAMAEDLQLLGPSIVPLTTEGAISSFNPRDAKRVDFGLCIDFLVALCFTLNLWDWTSVEVVMHLVKPLTEQFNRCRFT